MGNRASIVFVDQGGVSPTVYLHWHGQSVPAWLDQLKTRMEGRFGDASYAAARFIGLCHEQIDGNMSLGLISNGLTLRHLRSGFPLETLSPGDAGFVVVDTRDFTWKAYGGYLATLRDHQPSTPWRQS
jgi:hypothetical protein